MDTGLLLKHYSPEPQSEALQDWLEAHPESLPLAFSSLHEMELASALAAKEARGEITAAQRAEVWRDILADVAPLSFAERLRRRRLALLRRLKRSEEALSPLPPGPPLALMRPKWEAVLRRAIAEAGAAQGFHQVPRAGHPAHRRAGNARPYFPLLRRPSTRDGRRRAFVSQSPGEAGRLIQRLMVLSSAPVIERRKNHRRMALCQ